jgi:hypothetical protein
VNVPVVVPIVPVPTIGVYALIALMLLLAAAGGISARRRVRR